MEDNRFSTMMPKGINTYDADATDQDILQGKTAYVAGEKVTGTLVPGGGGEGDWSMLGFEIDIEAENTIMKGQKIVARENNQYVTRTYSTTDVSIPIACVSADESVAIGGTISSVAQYTEGTVIPIYFKTQEGTYDNSSKYEITLENYPYPSVKLFPPILNEDGTLAVSASRGNSSNYFNDQVILIIEIDKENKTASYSYHTLNYNDYETTTRNHYLRGLEIGKRGASPDNYFGSVCGNYIIASGGAAWENKNDTNKGTFSGYCNAYIKYENGSLIVKETAVNWNNPSSAYIYGNSVERDGYILSKDSYLTLYKYDKASNSYITGSASVLTSPITFSPNGHYLGGKASNYPALYELNIVDLSLVSVPITGVSDSGKFLIPSNDPTIYCDNYFRLIYKDVSPTLTSNSIPVSGVLGNPGRQLYSNSGNNQKILAIIPGTEAQYLAASTNSNDCSTSDRIYGVASQNLTVGVRGTARGLFSTMT